MRLLSFAAVAAMLFTAQAAQGAVTFGDGGAALQNVFDSITTSPTPGVSNLDVVNDQLNYDEVWEISGSSGSVSTIVIELAGFANSNVFGIYDPNSGNSVQIFAGSAGQGDQATIGFRVDGSVELNHVDTGVDFSSNGAFGYYLQTPNETFYSQTALNSDLTDHMAAYRGNEIDTIQIPGRFPGIWNDEQYALAWEDVAFPGADGDFDDFVVMVESVRPVPEPLSVICWAGLIGMVGIARWKRNR